MNMSSFILDIDCQNKRLMYGSCNLVLKNLSLVLMLFLGSLLFGSRILWTS